MNIALLSELCKCIGNQICSFCIQLTIVVLAMLIGGWFVWQPKRTIETQTAFYRLINWRVEPISMEKEIRNTRNMGALLLIIAIIALIAVIIMP